MTKPIAVYTCERAVLWWWHAETDVLLCVSIVRRYWDVPDGLESIEFHIHIEPGPERYSLKVRRGPAVGLPYHGVILDGEFEWTFPTIITVLRRLQRKHPGEQLYVEVQH